MRQMTWMFSGLLGWALIVSVSGAQAQEKPRITSITPKTIARGEKITIKGNFLKDAAPTRVERVEIDQKKVEFVEVEPGKKITVLVTSNPKPKTRKSAGEYERSVVVVVKGQETDPHTFRQLTWEVVRKPRVWGAVLLYLVLIVIIVISVKGTVFRSMTGQLSLSKIQMGIWTFIFGLSYVLLAAVWKEFLDITDGMFWLMGISSAAAVGAKAIVIRNQIDPDVPNPSKLLSDYNENTERYELSLHRCQIAIWTLIVLVIYVIDLIDKMHLPDIPPKLLVLMGISGGTYLGFNFPKRQ